MHGEYINSAWSRNWNLVDRLSNNYNLSWSQNYFQLVILILTVSCAYSIQHSNCHMILYSLIGKRSLIDEQPLTESNRHHQSSQFAHTGNHWIRVCVRVNNIRLLVQ